MSLDAMDQQPGTQSPDTTRQDNNTSAPGAPSSPSDGLSLNQTREAPSMSPAATQGAASVMSGSSAPDTRSRDQYGDVPQLKTRDASQVVAPVQKSPADIQAEQKHLTFVDKINAGAKRLAFGGNPPTDYKTLPDGTLTKVERPVPARYAWLSLIMGALSGAGAGMSEHGPGSVGRSFLDGQQQERQRQEQRKAANEQRQQQASQEFAVKAQTLENNLRMRQLAVSLSDHDFAHNQAVADSMKPFYQKFLEAGMIIPGTETGVTEEDLVKQYGMKATDNNVIPVAVEYIRDPATGETVKDSQGVEKVRFKYAVADPSKQIDVTPEMQQRMRYWNLPGWVRQDGNAVPQGNLFVRGTIALGGITQAAQLDTAQKELSDYAQRTTGKPLDPNFLRDSIQKGLVSRNDILALEKVEGGHPVDEAITALIKDAPDSAAKVRALYNSISPLDKFAEERAIRLNSEKHPGSTPASTDDTNKFTGASLRADFPHLSAGQISNFVARAKQKNVTGAQLETIRKDAGEAEDRQIKLLQGNEDKGNATLDRSYQFNSTQLEKAAKPIEDAVARFGRLQDTINQATPQADALIAPELLTVMAGGQGSGLRMNEAEISRIVGGRSKYESLKAALNQWQLDPSKALSITPAQRGQIKALMSEVYGKLQKKQQILESARDQLIGGTTPTEHRQAVANLRKQLDGIDAGPVNGNSIQVKAGGKVYTFPNQAAADQFKKTAGIQ